MAVRFDADTEEYTRALSLGVVTQFAVACWVKISVDRNNISTVWCVDNGGGDYIRLATTVNGTTLQIADDLGNHTLASAGVNTWQYVGFSMNGADATAVMQAATASTPSSFAWASGSPSQNLATLEIGDGVFDTQFLNGCVAAFKLWVGVTLTQAELEAEAWQYLPQRTGGLAAWYPFLRGEATDYSGNGRTLSGGTGTTAEDGPPIRWSVGRRRIIRFTGAALGEVAATLPALTGSASGAVVVAGQQSAVLPSLTAALDATATVEGQAPAVLPALAAGLAGEVGAPGLVDARLPALTGQLDGLLTGGFLTAQLPALTGRVDGELAVHGAAPAVLPALTGSLAGEAEIPHNNLDVTAGAPYRGWTSRPLAAAWTAGTPYRGWQARQPTT
ncbi:hypothetical protein ACIBQX_18820 [Nonomuraea sp. NPDC049714]|uniref:hypothetical protein n=1 Tax=Nonomuraea sp. NPDC049714 TaxID=3364357 RepID=UPI0037A00583